ncbi:hypothetical protein ACFPL7_11470 [Dongia soli]|uniref:Cupin domain-containing protein n=1 Tax=Dongia soli TaxID=600628 RepID=A0ABU5EBK3_9PROT|nr:hypothetical protein [Dongia soli]MDY0883568.1 hypothetical protein [Dongia soli]
MRHALFAAGAAILAATTMLTGAGGTPQGTTQAGGKLQETITPLLKDEPQNVPGKALLLADVVFPIGAASPSHTHPKSVFIRSTYHERH